MLTPTNGLAWPADLYIEGGDQYRGWFHSSLLVGVGLRGGAPYRACATNGWALDGEGRAMHKSLGNAIEPEDIIKHHGADVLRLWSASVEFTEDVRCPRPSSPGLHEAYRKLRNTFRYVLGNIHDFDPATDAVPGDELLELDQWILLRAEALVSTCRAWYDELAFHKVYRAFYDFATVDLSAIYFDVLKDRLYTARHQVACAPQRPDRPLPPGLRAGPAVRAHPQLHRRRNLAAFGRAGQRPYGIFSRARRTDRGHSRRAAGTRVENWNQLMERSGQRAEEPRSRRQAKFIGARLEARVGLRPTPLSFRSSPNTRASCPGLFIVSQVELGNHTAEGVDVKIARAPATKCDRCWKYTEDVGSAPRFPTICAACAEAVVENGENGEDDAHE